MSPARWVLVGLAALLVVVAAVVAVEVPRGEPVSKFDDLQTDPEAAVEIYLSADVVNATAGTIQTRVRIVPGPTMPPEGVRLFTDLGGLESVAVPPDAPVPEKTAVMVTSAGEVSDYPFDRYQSGVLIYAVRGADTTAADATTDAGQARRVRVAVYGLASAAGFDIQGRTEERPRGAGLAAFDIERDLNVRAWAVGMMAINWLLAAAAVAVALTVILRQRDWESRHLAWLGSMLFALAAFRNTAPGNPPIGTFLDFYAFFPAVALVAISLLALVANYLVRPRRQLGL